MLSLLLVPEWAEHPSLFRTDVPVGTHTVR